MAPNSVTVEPKPSRAIDNNHSTAKPGVATKAQGSVSDDGLARKTRPMAVLVTMTTAMFVINVAQLALLRKLVGSLWLTLFPALIFAAFMVVFLFVCLQQHEPKNDKPLVAFDSARRNESLNRLSIVATLTLCVVLCQFVYVNNNAVRDFKEITWTAGFTVIEELPAPAMAVFRARHEPNQANFVPKGNATEQCRMAANNSKGQYDCFTDSLTFEPELGGAIDYEVYDPREYNFTMRAKRPLVLFFEYSYNSTSGRDPTLDYSVFDPRFLDVLPQAWKCGLLQLENLPAIGLTDLRLEVVSIMDKQHVTPAHPNRDCRDIQKRIPSFATYRTTMQPYRQAHTMYNNHCDVASNYTGPCWHEFDILPLSLTNTSHTSRRKYAFKQALIEEGGIVGFVQFFVYFLTIWK